MLEFMRETLVKHTRLPQGSVLDKTFHIGLWLKGLNGVLEVVGGLIVLLLPQRTLEQAINTFNHYEFSEGSLGNVLSHFQASLQHVSTGTKLFAAAYLLSHGIIKLVLVIALLKDKLWAYPWMIAVLVGFIIYQAYLLIHHISFGLVLLTVFDVFILALTILEYRKHRHAAKVTE